MSVVAEGVEQKRAETRKKGGGTDMSELGSSTESQEVWG